MNQSFELFLQENGADEAQIAIIAVLVGSAEYRGTFLSILKKKQATFSKQDLIDQTLNVVIDMAKQKFVELYEGDDSIYIFDLNYLKDICYMWLYDMKIPLDLIKSAEDFCSNNHIYYLLSEELFRQKGEAEALEVSDVKAIFSEFNSKYGKKKEDLSPAQKSLLGLLNCANASEPEKISILAMANNEVAAREFIDRLFDAILNHRYTFSNQLCSQICADMYLFSKNVNRNSCPELFYPEEYALSLRGPLKDGERLYSEKHNEENPKLRQVISVIKELEGKDPTKLC